MADWKIKEYLKAGYPHFKEYSGLPAWLLPERSFAVVVDSMNDTRILKLSSCLELSGGIETAEYDNQSAETWQQACLDWPQVSLVNDVIMALFESINRVMTEYYKGELKIELQSISRVLSVISFSPFVPRGKKLLQNIATILNGDANNPADLIRLYNDSVLNAKLTTTARINEHIDKHQDWTCWVDSIQQMALDCITDYKLVAITPPLSEELVDVLTEMMKEVASDGA